MKQEMIEYTIFRQNDLNKGLSFGAICAAGANAVILHYSASETTNSPIKKDDMLLLDSGGQYLYVIFCWLWLVDITRGVFWLPS